MHKDVTVGEHNVLAIEVSDDACDEQNIGNIGTHNVAGQDF